MMKGIGGIAEGQVTRYAITGLLIVGVGLVGYFAIANPLLKFIGLKDSAADKKAKRMSGRAQDSPEWTATYYNDRQNKLTINATEANQIAAMIYSSWGLFNDNESSLFSSFPKIKNKEDLSYIISRYNDLYENDLLAELINRLSSEELIRVFTITENLK